MHISPQPHRMVLSHRHGCESTKSIQCVSTQDNDAWVKDETFFCLPLYPFYLPYFMVFLLPLSSSSPVLLKLHLSPVLYILSHLTFFFLNLRFFSFSPIALFCPEEARRWGWKGSGKGERFREWETQSDVPDIQVSPLRLRAPQGTDCDFTWHSALRKTGVQ